MGMETRTIRTFGKQLYSVRGNSAATVRRPTMAKPNDAVRETCPLRPVGTAFINNAAAPPAFATGMKHNAQTPPVELEVKFCLPRGAAATLATHPALQGGKRQSRDDVTTYYDTPDRALARAGISLRVRSPHTDAESGRRRAGRCLHPPGMGVARKVRQPGPATPARNPAGPASVRCSSPMSGAACKPFGATAPPSSFRLTADKSARAKGQNQSKSWNAS